MKIFQLIFRGGRVQNLMADRWLRRDDSIHFQAGRTTHEFPAGSVIMIDELSDDGQVASEEDRMSWSLSTANS